MKKTTSYLMLVMVIAASIVSACSGQQAPNAADTTSATGAASTSIAPDQVIAEGHLVPARDTTLNFQGAGTIVDVKVKTGDTVKTGDMLARLGGESDAA